MSASVAEHRERVVEHIEIARRISAQNIQRAQQRMKDLHDRYAEPTQFQLGDRVWVFCPKNRKGVSKKLAHNYHGPYWIVEFLSPVHCILRATHNRRVSTTVHVSRLKRYIDPADRPSREPLFQVDEPFLADSDLPTDSFISEDLNLDLSRHQALAESDDVDTAPSPATNVPPVSAASLVRPPSSLGPKLSGFSSTPTPAASEPAVSLASASRLLADSDGAPTDLAVDRSTVYQAERIMRHRIRNGKPQFLLKWSGFPHDQNTWEPREHLLDDRLLKDYLKRNPGAKRVLNPDPDYNPPVAAISSSPRTEASSVVAFLTLEIDSTCCDDALLLVTRLKKPLLANNLRHVQLSQLSTTPAQKPGPDPTTPQPPPVQCDIGTQSLSTSPTSDPVPLSTLPLTAVTIGPPVLSPRSPSSLAGPALTLPCYQGNKHQFPGLHSYVIMLLCFYLTVYGQHIAVAATGFDATGREIGFFPKAMMLAKDPKALILYQDTTLVSLHMDLNLASRIKFPDLNSTCDPALFKFYTHVLDSLRGIQRTVTRLSSIHGVTNLFECDSYLRRFYTCFGLYVNIELSYSSLC